MKKFRKILKYVIMAVCVLGVFSVTAIALILEPNVKIHGFASLDEQKLMVPVGIIRVLDDDGDDIAPNAANKNRRFTPLTSVPAHTRDAFVAIEDKRFYKHGGIDYGRVAAAAKKDLASRSFREGASTITQQLIKNTHLSADKSLKRKVQEMRIARALERKFSKDEILEMYLNILYFGNRLYGIDAAADAMFGKSVPELSLAESALLAGIINNPSRYNPYSRPENAVARRNLVLSKMTEGGKITKDECAEASAEALQLAPLNTTENRYMSASIREAAGILGFGEQELYRRNVTVATSLDGRVQSIADAALAEAALEAGVVAQVLVINNHSGEVLGFSGAGGPNLEILRRNPASTVKPALVYAPAIEKRLAFPITPILDEKTDFNGYSPDNYKHRYEAWTSVGDALAQSSNVCAVKLMEQCGVEYCQNFASGLGYDFTGGDGHLALSLGAMENGLTLLQIANSFQAFANGGCFIPAGFIRYIQDGNGRILYERKPCERRVMNDSTAYFINRMLAACAREGTARKLSGCAKYICGKTGTAGNEDGNTDAYCIAYTPEYTVAVWIGAKDASELHQISGGGTPSAIARTVFLRLKPQNSRGFPRPASVKEVELDAAELHKTHRLVLADESLLPRYRKTAELPSDYYVPRK